MKKEILVYKTWGCSPVGLLVRVTNLCDVRALIPDETTVGGGGIELPRQSQSHTFHYNTCDPNSM